MKLTTREKILITILLGVLYSWLLGCGKSPEHSTRHEHFVYTPASASGIADAAHLKSVFAVYNDEYFQGRLETPEIDMLEPDQNNMASTLCKNDTAGVGLNCIIHFNPHYVIAPRTGDETLLHEMCHIKTWNKDVDDLGGQIAHGRNWRSCMLQLDMQGAFRQLIIDNYKEDMK
jgi:hypothetical protein